MFPWIEANQGFLSLLALILALLFGFMEFRAAHRSARELFQKDVDIAVDVINRVTVSLHAFPPMGVATAEDVDEFASIVSGALSSITTMGGARAHTALHAIALQDALDQLTWIKSQTNDRFLTPALRDAVRGRLDRARASVLGSLPRSMGRARQTGLGLVTSKLQKS